MYKGFGFDEVLAKWGPKLRQNKEGLPPIFNPDLWFFMGPQFPFTPGIDFRPRFEQLNGNPL